VQKPGTYLKCKLSYGEVCVKISKFLLPWQQGLSGANFTYTVKSVDPENPLFGARIFVIALIQAKWCPIFCWSLPISVAMATRVSLPKIWMLSLIGLPSKPPVWGNILGPILNESWVMVNFAWKFPNFCYHGNRGSLTQISLTQLNRPKNPYLMQESWWYLLYKPILCPNDVLSWQQGWSKRNLYDTVRLSDPENPQFGANILHVSLTVPELWLFKLAIGRNANFQILGAKEGKFQFLLTKPYKECECHQNESFKPLTTKRKP